MTEFLDKTSQILDHFLPVAVKQNAGERLRSKLVVAATLITSVLMWSYAWTSFIYIDHISLRYTGFVYTLIHLSALLTLRFGGSIALCTNNILIPGYLFQVHFSILNGGPESHVIMWIAILPVIAGLLAGQRLAIIWGIVVIATAALMITMVSLGFVFPQALAEGGNIVLAILTIMGFLILNSLFTVIILKYEQWRTDAMHQRMLSKSNVLRVMSHDINNPLSALVMSAHVLDRKIKTDDPSKTYVEKVLRHSKRIHEILESARLLEGSESGKIDLPLSQSDVRDSIENVADLLSDAIRKKRVSIEGNWRESSCLVNINKACFENQVLANLISNAVKFSAFESRIEINLYENKQETMLEIKDFGIGMPAETMKSLFDPFMSTHREGTDGESGTGLGMPIVKAVLDQMFAEIRVESHCRSQKELQSGTTFTIVFPRPSGGRNE